MELHSESELSVANAKQDQGLVDGSIENALKSKAALLTSEEDVDIGEADGPPPKRCKRMLPQSQKRKCIAKATKFTAHKSEELPAETLGIGSAVFPDKVSHLEAEGLATEC